MYRDIERVLAISIEVKDNIKISHIEEINGFMRYYFATDYYWYSDNTIIVNLTSYRKIYRDENILCADLKQDLSGLDNINSVKLCIAEGVYTAMIFLNDHNRSVNILDSNQREEYIDRISVMKLMFIRYSARKLLYDLGIRKVCDISRIDSYLLSSIIKDRDELVLLKSFSQYRDVSANSLFGDRNIDMLINFSKPTIDVAAIMSNISFQSERLFYSMASKGISPNKIFMRIYFEDGKYYGYNKSVRNIFTERDIYMLLKKMIRKGITRRCGIIRIYIKVYEFSNLVRQYDIFGHTNYAIDDSITKIRNKYGFKNILFARSLNKKM